jgi:hypothetical protein
MKSDAERTEERSVDSLQQIYAVVIALAISQAIQSLLKDPSSGAVLKTEEILAGLPPFVAFLVTLLPFWHGMNRHLDRCYLEKKQGVVHGALLFDFGAFFIEASLLFAAGWSLRSGIDTFVYLGLLLAVDMLWGFVSHLIHFRGAKSHVRRWSAINVVAMAISVLVVGFPFQYKINVLMAVAIFRSIADYSFCWRFYFPGS